MADISEIGAVERFAIRIEVPAHWADHRFQGRAVLPAVEAMQLLAHWTRSVRPGVAAMHIRQAVFGKFLDLPPGGEAVDAFCEVADLPGGGVLAALATRRRAKSAAFTRSLVHARIAFGAAPRPQTEAFALDTAAALTGPCFYVAPGPLYESLVPFGPAYRNIVQPLRLAREGALAIVRAPDISDPQTGRLLGSPFVADAAFHAACVWSQRFAGVVAFPVGFEARRIVTPTRSGQTYIARIFPVQTDREPLVFDIWILDPGGGLCEAFEGVHMRDVSGGRLRPPGWIGAGKGGQADVDADGGISITLVERSSVMPYAERCLSERERRRLETKGPKRRNGYLAARLACKRLFRTLRGGDRTTPAQQIETLSADGLRPGCPPIQGGSTWFWAVAHDRRFAVAAAAQQRVGVDVEALNARLLKSLHLFTSADEQTQMSISELPAVEAAVRIWSIKEAAAKALDITLADAWRRAEVIRIGAGQSRLRIDHSRLMTACHRAVDDHVITWLVIEDCDL